MHELSVAQNIMEIVQSNLPVDNTSRVNSVKIRVGRVSGVVPESLSFCFTAITQDTPLAGASLDIENIPFMVRCRTCNVSFESEMGIVLCPKCGGIETEVLSGFDLQVVAIELDDDEPPMNADLHEALENTGRR